MAPLPAYISDTITYPCPTITTRTMTQPSQTSIIISTMWVSRSCFAMNRKSFTAPPSRKIKYNIGAMSKAAQQCFWRCSALQLSGSEHLLLETRILYFGILANSYAVIPSWKQVWKTLSNMYNMIHPRQCVSSFHTFVRANLLLLFHAVWLRMPLAYFASSTYFICRKLEMPRSRPSMDMLTKAHRNAGHVTNLDFFQKLRSNVCISTIWDNSILRTYAQIKQKPPHLPIDHPIVSLQYHCHQILQDLNLLSSEC